MGTVRNLLILFRVNLKNVSVCFQFIRKHLFFIIVWLFWSFMMKLFRLLIIIICFQLVLVFYHVYYGLISKLSQESTSCCSAGKNLYPTNHTLVNIVNFSFHINNDICQNEKVTFVIIVHTAPNNVRSREILRATWTNISTEKFYLKLVFLLGEFDNLEVQKQLESENEKYADIVQGKFVD